MTPEQILKQLADAPETVTELIEDLAKLDRIEYAKISAEVREAWKLAGISLHDLRSALKEARQKIERERRAARAEKIREQNKQTGIPVFVDGDHAELAEKVFCHYLSESRGHIARDLGETWRYDWPGRHWTQIGDAEVSVLIQSWRGAEILTDDDKIRTLKINNVRTPTEMFVDRAEADTEPGFFAKAPRGVVFEDAAFVFVDGELEYREPGPDLRNLSTLPFRYADRNPAPTFRGYLETVFGDADDARTRVMLLQEFVGAALCRLAPRFHRAMIACGPPGTGKSTFLEIVSALFPRERRTNIPPQKLDDDYHGADLAGKWLNIVYELPEQDVLEEAGFKSVVVGEEMQRRRPYGQPFSFRPEAAHLFAANALPVAPSATRAFWDRWLVVEFDNRFRNTPDERRDIAAIVCAEELPGVAEWALDGAVRLLKQDGYTIPRSSADAMDDWKEDANPIVAWANAALEEGGFTSTRDLHDEWKPWARDAGHHTLARTTFGRRIAQIFEAARVGGVRGYECTIIPDWKRDEDEEIPF